MCAIDGLYRGNSLSRFWHLEPDVGPEAWKAAAAAAVGMLAGGPEILAEHGWDGLMTYILGEAQFGANRYSLSRSKRLYYVLRPILPRRLALVARRRYRTQQARAFPLRWPIEDRYVRFLYRVLEHAVGQPGAAGQPDGAASRALAGVRRRGFWPGGARFALVLTHDVEGAAGQAAVRVLADLEERYGFRSSFNFVPEAYRVDISLLAELRQRGFEVGVHGLKHDAKLFWSRAEFDRRVAAINHYLREWDAVGFRAPYAHRHPEWMQALDIEYDSSFFDTDPYEPMPGGTMSVWPYFCGRFVELPYTLAQDHTLLVLLGQGTPRLWLEKVEFLSRWGGMALVIVHPDYMRDPSRLRVYEKFLQCMADWRTEREAGSRDGDVPQRPAYWHALPRDVARWWRARVADPEARSASQ